MWHPQSTYFEAALVGTTFLRYIGRFINLYLFIYLNGNAELNSGVEYYQPHGR